MMMEDTLPCCFCYATGSNQKQLAGGSSSGMHPGGSPCADFSFFLRRENAYNVNEKAGMNHEPGNHRTANWLKLDDIILQVPTRLSAKTAAQKTKVFFFSHPLKRQQQKASSGLSLFSRNNIQSTHSARPGESLATNFFLAYPKKILDKVK